MANVELLKKKLEDPLISLFEKVEAINQLEKDRGREAIEIIKILLHHDEQYLRREAALALGNIPDPSHVEELIHVLNDKDPEVRKNAIIAIGRLGGSKAEEVLRKNLQDESWIVRYFAERALADMKEKNAEMPQKSPETGKSDPPAPVLTTAVTSIETAIKIETPLRAAAVETIVKSLDIDELMRKIIEGTQIRLEKVPQGFLLTVPLKNSRKQRVFVSLREDDMDAGMGLIVLYTTCGKASSGLYRWALTANAKMAYGGIALREIEGVEYFTISYTSLISAATAPGMLRIIQDLAAKGDWIEKNLTRTEDDIF